MPKIEQYKQADQELPKEYKAWQIFGAGFENVGKNGEPSTLELREPRDNEILLRVDALGLCLSDIKVIKQGSNHARLLGRDLMNDPTILGHECAATVVKVGKDWQDKFKAGQRFIVQADIYYKGVNYAFGYAIPGGLGQYTYLDERALAGDEGCYLLPVKDYTGYSETALAEPWACVEMSYRVQDRLAPGKGKALVVTDDPIEKTYANTTHVPHDLEGLPEDEMYEDILLWDPTPQLVETLEPRLNKNGVMYLIGEPLEKGQAEVDIGRIHYQGIRIIGGGSTLEEIAEANRRKDLKPGGSALFVGAGGPMGQMHVQRAIEFEEGPKLVVVTDLDRGRLDHIEHRFGNLARERGVTLKTYSPKEFESQAELNKELGSLTKYGYDDICILAPVAALITDLLPMAAENGLVNVFAGVIVGSKAPINIEDICRGVRIYGTSGSRISDLQKVLELVEDRKLNTNLSVAAIGGLNTAKEGLEGLRDARFPGKTVIYPQVPDLPLLSIEEIPEKLPDIKDKLGLNGEWTKEAEEALIEKYGV